MVRCAAAAPGAERILPPPVLRRLRRGRGLPGGRHVPGLGGHIVWNTDYPHVDAPDPDKALPSLLAQPISDEAKKKILWDNAVKLYGQRILA